MKKPIEHFFNDIDDPSVAVTLSHYVLPNPISVSEELMRHAPWKEVSAAFVICEKDLSMGTAIQERMTDRSRGGSWQVFRLAAGHCPFHSMLEDVTGLIEHFAMALVKAENIG